MNMQEVVTLFTFLRFSSFDFVSLTRLINGSQKRNERSGSQEGEATRS